MRPEFGSLLNWKIVPGGGEDCDDSNAEVIGETYWYYDYDGDGYYGQKVFECYPPDTGDPSKWSTNQLTDLPDCDDNNHNKGLKNACGVCEGDPEKVYWDFDGDGYAGFEMGPYCNGVEIYKGVVLSLDYLISIGYPAEAFDLEKFDGVTFTNELNSFRTYSSDGITYEDYLISAIQSIDYPFHPPYDTLLDPHYRYDNVHQFAYTNREHYLFLVSQIHAFELYGSKTSLGQDCNDLNPNIWANGEYYTDKDQDGYHDPDVAPLSATCQPPGDSYILLANSRGIDCDDEDGYANLPKTWYFDNDGDNYYSRILVSCVNPGKETGTIDKWQTDSGNGEDCNDFNTDATISKNWYKDADDDSYYSDIVENICVNPGTATGEENLWKSDPGFGEDCDDTNPGKQTSNACNICGGSDDPVKIYLDIDGDGYHSVYKSEDCGLPSFSGDQIRSSAHFPSILLPQDSNVMAYFIDLPGTTYRLSYTKKDSVTEIFIFHEDLLKDYSLGPDCDDLNPDVKAYGQWFPDRDNDGYHDANAPPIVSCQPSTQITYLLIQHSKGPDCDDQQFAYNEIQTWYRDTDGDGYFVDIMESCYDPGLGWSLTATKGPDDNDSNVFSPSGLPGDEEFILPGLFGEVTNDAGDSLIVYSGDYYYKDSLRILYRGATFSYTDIIYDQINPDTLLTGQKLAVGGDDVLYGAVISGPVYT
ncbi:MAG: hypothetical protein WBA74_22735, partial [Cyclobacteriaceae bacterium]